MLAIEKLSTIIYLQRNYSSHQILVSVSAGYRRLYVAKQMPAIFTEYNFNSVGIILTLHLSVMPRPRLVPDNRPFLEFRSIILQEKRKPKIRRNCTIGITGPEEHRSVGWIVMRQHLYRTVRRGDFRTSKIKHWLNLGIDFIHNILNVFTPYLDRFPAARAVFFGRARICADHVSAFVALIGGKWRRVVPLI